MVAYKWGTFCDTEFDKLILKVSNEFDDDAEEFFSECLYKNRSNMLYLHITWGRRSNSPAKRWLIKEYGSITDDTIILVDREMCKAWLKHHSRYEDIEQCIFGADRVLRYATNILLGAGEFEEF